MNNTFYVLKDEEGVLRPMAFICPADETGDMRKEMYEKKMDEGESIVKVTMTEV